MRRINPSRFRIATRGTSRDINSRIVLNLVRAHQPISRADLARTMGVSRAAVTLIVNDLLERKLIFEGATGETVRGRKPTFLYIDSRRRAVIAADIRASQTYVMLADLLGKPLTGVVSFPTARDPKTLVETLATAVKKLLAEHPEVNNCAGIGHPNRSASTRDIRETPLPRSHPLFHRLRTGTRRTHAQEDCRLSPVPRGQLRAGRNYTCFLCKRKSIQGYQR